MGPLHPFLHPPSVAARDLLEATSAAEEAQGTGVPHPDVRTRTHERVSNAAARWGFRGEDGGVPRAPANTCRRHAEGPHDASVLVQTLRHPRPGLPAAPLPPASPVPRGSGEERDQLVWVHRGASPSRVLPTCDFVGDALEEQLLEDALVTPQGSATSI